MSMLSNISDIIISHKSSLIVINNFCYMNHYSGLTNKYRYAADNLPPPSPDGQNYRSSQAVQRDDGCASSFHEA